VTRALTLLLLAALAGMPLAAAAKQGVTFKAADGVRVFADFYQAKDPKASIIVLFHRAGSNKAEYASIAPRLKHDGFACLAVDLRSGGDDFHSTNQTAAGFGRKADYLESIPDMEAALGWAKGHARTVLLWGSSYSASLVFVVTDRHRAAVAGVLAFSPGEYFDSDKHLVRNAARNLKVPVFITQAKDPVEIARAKQILDVIAVRPAVQFIPKTAGIHGSSTLDGAEDPQGAAENWAAVEKFLLIFAHAPR
jgi:dienelactone hydrolase